MKTYPRVRGILQADIDDGMSLRAVCRKVDLHPNTVGSYLEGRSRPDEESLNKLSKAYGKPVVLSPEELFGITEYLTGEHRLQVMCMGIMGLRKGELHQMKRYQVDLVNSVIHVIGKGDKERKQGVS